jgi:hypothetical protein
MRSDGCTYTGRPCHTRFFSRLLSPPHGGSRRAAGASRFKYTGPTRCRRPTSVSPNFGWVKTRPGDEFSEQFYIKITNLSPKRPITITHVWVESLDRSRDDVQIMNPERPLPARLGLDDQYETWIPVSDVPEPELGAEWRFRVKLTSDKTIKSRPNRKVPPSGYVAGGGETSYAAPIGTTASPGVTGINPETLKAWSDGPTTSASATYVPPEEEGPVRD